MKQTSDIKVIFLDIDNTILDFDAAAEESMKECFRRAGLVYKLELLSVFNNCSKNSLTSVGAPLKKWLQNHISDIIKIS